MATWSTSSGVPSSRRSGDCQHLLFSHPLAAPQHQPWLLEPLNVTCTPRHVGLRGLSLLTPPSCCANLTLLEASMNFTPLYVMDSIMVGIFFMCSVDFLRNKNIRVTS